MTWPNMTADTNVGPVGHLGLDGSVITADEHSNVMSGVSTGVNAEA